MKNIDWSKAPEGATHAYQHGDEKITWYKDIKKNSYSFRHDSHYTWTVYEDKGFENRPVWHPLIPRPTPWKGPQDGLPPVGSECELETLSGSWRKCEILAHRNGRAVFYSPHNGTASTQPASSFRPIQSELDKLLNYAHNLVDKKLISSNASADGSFSLESIIEVLFHAGMLVDPERKPMSRKKAIYKIQRLVPDLDTAQAMAIADMLGHED